MATAEEIEPTWWEHEQARLAGRLTDPCGPGCPAPPEEPGRYRKKEVVVEALRWDGANIGAALAFMQPLEALPNTGPNVDPGVGYLPALGHLEIPTLEGTMTAEPGDWIVKGLVGEFYPCKPAAFIAGFDPEEGEPRPNLGELTIAGTPYPVESMALAGGRIVVKCTGTVTEESLPSWRRARRAQWQLHAPDGSLVAQGAATIPAVPDMAEVKDSVEMELKMEVMSTLDLTGETRAPSA